MEATDKSAGDLAAARVGMLLVTVGMAGSLVALVLFWLPGRLDALLGPSAGLVLTGLAAAGAVGALLALLYVRLSGRRQRAAPASSGHTPAAPSAAALRARERAARLARERGEPAAPVVPMRAPASVPGDDLDFSRLGAINER